MKKKIEILAPAGSYDSFRAALAAGADAVYAGGPRFGARAYAENFTEKSLAEAIQEAHLHGRKFYLTVNTLLKDCEISTLYEYLAPLYERGLDAVIVQDIGVFSFVRKHFPDMDIHASTQMTITDALGAKFLEEQGASRVVPARELSVDEIKRIHEMTDLEIECFVHGALCYCYSGQCLMSSMIGGRSGNRGQCAQPCRLPYTIKSEKKYFLSLKDICTLEMIPELVDAGIDSFKIEGRMKKPEYVAAVTAMYRKYTDLYLKKGREGFHVLDRDRQMLMDLYNRGGSGTGYYRQHNGKNMLSLERPNHTGVPAVKVTAQNGREVIGIALTDLGSGDVLETGGGRENHTVGECVDEGGKLSFLVSKGLKFAPGTVLNRTRNGSVLKSMKELYVSSCLQEKIYGFFSLKESAPASLTVCFGEISFTAVSGEVARKAQKTAVTEEQVRGRLIKTGNTPFLFQTLDIEMDQDMFFPMQCLNSLRRDALEGLKEKIVSAHFRVCKTDSVSVEETKYSPAEYDLNERDTEQTWSPIFSVFTETSVQLSEVRNYIRNRDDSGIRRIYADCHMDPDFFVNHEIRQILSDIRNFGVQVYTVMPRIFRADTEASMERVYDRFADFPMDGTLIRNYESWYYLSKHGFDKPIITDHNLYVFNRYGKEFWKSNGAEFFTAPLELTGQELMKLDICKQEMIVYGYTPMMVTAQCVTSTVGECRKTSGVSVLTDRYQNRFPAKNFCDSCFNVIYNTTPLYLGDRHKEIRRLEPGFLRVQFSIESKEQVAGILNLLKNAFDGREYEPEFEHTQGHFRRGVL